MTVKLALNVYISIGQILKDTLDLTLIEFLPNLCHQFLQYFILK